MFAERKLTDTVTCEVATFAARIKSNLSFAIEQGSDLERTAQVLSSADFRGSLFVSWFAEAMLHINRNYRQKMVLPLSSQVECIVPFYKDIAITFKLVALRCGNVRRIYYLSVRNDLDFLQVKIHTSL